MAESLLDPESDTIDAEAAFIDRMAAKYEAQDRTSGNTQEAKEDALIDDAGDDESDEGDGTDVEGTDATDDGAGDEEHTDEDTSTDDPDGDAADSAKDSAKGKAKPDHTKDAEKSPSKESDDDAKTDDDDEATEDQKGDDADEDDDDVEGDGTAEGEEDETRLSAEFEAAAARLSIPLTLEDVPEGPARQLVQQKLLNMDRAFTRAMQAETAYRKEEVQFRADQQFRAENPDLVIVEMLREHPELFDKINERLDRLADPDNEQAFKIIVKDARKASVDAIVQKIAESEHVVSRYQHVEGLSRRLAAKAQLPWEFAESAIERALLRRPAEKRDLTDEEVVEIVGAEATNYNRHIRAHRREESKRVVKDRIANKRSTPGAKNPSSAASPKPTTPKRKAIDFNNEDERHAAMMKTARRLFPGAKDE